MAPDGTNLDSISDDGYWRLKEGEWVATEKQITELENGASPHDYVPALSDDGFWKLIDGNWEPSHKQLEFLQEGTVPYDANQNIADAMTFHSTINVDHNSKMHTIITNLEPNQRLYVVISALLLVILLVISVIVVSISPDTIHEDRLDSDSDGILNSTDLCPFGDSNWNSGNESDFDGDGCKDLGEDLDDDNDGVLDLVDLCQTGSMDWVSENSTDFDGDGCNDLGEDLDDDNDGWTDIEESSCNTDSKDVFSVPLDADEDNICNYNEDANFEWVYNSQQYSIYLPLELSVYNYYKNKNHTVITFALEEYTKYVTPNATYVIQIAQLLETLAIEEGYTSQLEKAEFILAFVGDIPYVLDGEDVEYPKYPIETLWDNGGDCEDSSALYSSLMEALDYDTILVDLDVKGDASDTWGAHLMVGISIPGHSGEAWFELENSTTKYFDAETTGWFDEYDGIGINSWYAMDVWEFYEVP